MCIRDSNGGPLPSAWTLTEVNGSNWCCTTPSWDGVTAGFPIDGCPDDPAFDAIVSMYIDVPVPVGAANIWDFNLDIMVDNGMGMGMATDSRYFTITTSACTPLLVGCMDTTACNYDASATFDDGSCLVDYGCMDA